MVQAWRKVDFGTGTVTFLDDTQKEDMLQVEYPNGFLLDMGWYQDRYIISIIHNFDWTHPVKRYETADGNQLPALLTEAVRFVEKKSRTAEREKSEVNMMQVRKLEGYRDKIKAAYEASAFTKGTRPEPEDAVKRFESRYTPIPAEYRWLLLNFGGCYLAEPWIFTLKELEEAYPIFQEAYEDYMSEYDHDPAFPIGGLGDGSIVFIDLESGRVRGYNCDYADLEEIAENFSSLLLGLVEQALELGNLCKEL